MYFIVANLLIVSLWVIFKKLKKSWKKTTAIIIMVIALPVYFLLFQLLGMMVNFTPSLPVGIYIKSITQNIQTGDIAAYCLENEEYIRLAKERGYLGSGTCHSGLKPLLKEVGGKEGDLIGCGVRGQITVNGKLIENTAIADIDLNGAKMPPTLITYGLIPVGKVFLISRHAGGFDSRYFGLVDIDKLTKYRALITF